MKGFAVILLLAAFLTTTNSERPKKRQNKGCRLKVSDIRTILKNGETYTHRCDVYTCVKGKLQENIHRCKFRLGFKHENVCQQWSEDGCCCDKIGCTDVNGVKHAPGTWYQTKKSRDPTRPKCGRYCKCKPGRKLCRLSKCGRKPKRIETALKPLHVRHMKVLFVHEQ